MARKTRVAKAAPAVVLPKLLRGKQKLCSVDLVTPHPKNNRKGDVDEIMASMRENGIYGDIFVWEQTSQIIVGSHRWKAAKRLGVPKLYMTFLDLTEAQAAKILAVDNRTSDKAKYDDEKTVELLKHIVEVNGGSLVGTGYQQTDLAALLKKIAPPQAPAGFGELNPGGMQLLRTCPRCQHQF